MAINADKPHLWKEDIATSVKCFNGWFLRFAPRAFRQARVRTTKQVEQALRDSRNLAALNPNLLRNRPALLQTLRMCTCPPLARDRLVGLACVPKNLVKVMEEGRLPARMNPSELDRHLGRLLLVLGRLLDRNVFPWLGSRRPPTEAARRRAATLLADRLSRAVADPIIRNAQERRQLQRILEHLEARDYEAKPHPSTEPLASMEPGTFAFHMNVMAGGHGRTEKIPIDIVIQPRKPRKQRLPILMEAKSAGDFTNVNKRRKEEATKARHLRETYGSSLLFVLFLCGYFDTGYLDYEAAEDIDWVWEHRTEDLDKLGL